MAINFPITELSAELDVFCVKLNYRNFISTMYLDPISIILNNYIFIMMIQIHGTLTRKQYHTDRPEHFHPRQTFLTVFDAKEFSKVRKNCS